MHNLTTLRRMQNHAAWANAALLDVVVAHADGIPDVLREFAHILGAGDTWLARIAQRQPRLAVWPSLDAEQVAPAAEQLRSGYASLFASLGEDDLERVVTYVNSAGAQFTNSMGDILTHVALHAQYHRGKINLLLRDGGATPVPTDFISYVRGAPAATEATGRPPAAASATLK